MRIYGLQSDKRVLSATIKAAGRDFLAQIKFEREESRLDHHVGNIIRASLDGPAHEGAARAFCARLLEGIKSYRVYVWKIGDTLKALAERFPVAVLDVLVEPENGVSGIERELTRQIDGKEVLLLDHIPADVCMSWAALRPESRYLALAQVMSFCSEKSDEENDKNRDKKSVVWTALAKTVVDAAPEPAKVLDVLLSRLTPTSYDGSAADIMERRVPLIQELESHAKPEIAAWAKENVSAFRTMIETERRRETEHDRQRDERFE